MKNKNEDKVKKCLDWIRLNGLCGQFGASKERFFKEVVDERTFLRLLRRRDFLFLIDLANKDYVGEMERKLSARLYDIAMGKESGEVEAIIYLLTCIDPEKWKRVNQVDSRSLDSQEFKKDMAQCVDFEEL